MVLYWPNGCLNSDIWHTNLFAVPLDEAYWPPLASPESQDVLERMWGLQLTERQLPGVVRNHNSNDKRFVHAHLSERREAWPERAVCGNAAMTLCITGYLPWWRRLFLGLGRLLGVSASERAISHVQNSD